MIQKVCIPTAGIGSRVREFSKGLNKSLIEINNKPVISYIIEKYNEKTEFIIPTGYGSSELKQFLKLAYPERNFTFIDVDLYEGEGSGLGYTLLKAKKYLQEPFIFNSCDTIIKGDIPSLENNWIGISHKTENKEYRTIKEDRGLVKDIYDKNENASSKNIYIGLAGIKDYDLFWKKINFKNHNFINEGEAFGLKKLISKKIKVVKFCWFDTGNPIELKKTRRFFKNKENHNILDKEGESIWFVNNRVIKYSNDKVFIKNRVKRSKFLKNYIPEIENNTINMYSYIKEDGEILSKNITLELFKKLLDYLKIFWVERDINQDQRKYFFSCCKKFYKDKTYERIEKFYKKYSYMKNIVEINSRKVLSLETLLANINWQELNNGIIGRFHGDFHFENIIWNSKKKKFTFLDWRQDFGGEIEFGDVYYDLAKLKHGIIVQHEFMIKNKFKIFFKNRKLTFNFVRNFNHIECERFFNNWLLENKYDVKKVNIMTALIYLNIAPLHHQNYDEFLFALGYYLLDKELH